MENNEEYSAEWYREQGKMLFFHNNGDRQMRSQGLDYIIKAYTMKDIEATYTVATLMMDGVLKPSGDADPNEFAKLLLLSLADRGDMASRNLLNRICISNYVHSPSNSAPNAKAGRLVDFDGKPIKIKRKGLLTPIDAELKRIDGKNVLSLSANIIFLYTEKLNDPERFQRSVIEGIQAWQGDYTVFGGQPLEVYIHLTMKPRLFDNVVIVPITQDVEEATLKLTDALGTQSVKKRADDLMTSKRSYATLGVKKWSVRSRKFIFIQSRDGFTNYDEIKSVTTHEFGHSLGLGDLYESAGDGFAGVDKGTYGELDSFYVSDKIYNLVMCDHHGPISNNDIEMILLAFRDNKIQLYQQMRNNKTVSEALGKGN